MKARNVDVQIRPWSSSQAGSDIEMCEHKGAGHPDTLVDGVCEAASRALSQASMRACGHILHHNLDKGLLAAGRSEPRFGGGRILSPMRFIVCGRATPLPHGESVTDIVKDAARRYLREQVGLELPPGYVCTEIGETSLDLQQVFRSGHGVARANDTSFGVGYAPYSELEERVLAVARTIRSQPFRALFPAAGADFKVMGLRRRTHLSLTVALALVDLHVNSAAHCREIKQGIQAALAAELPPRASLRLNALDDPQASDESGLYLTVTGLSAEMGDDGQVGRGNRVNGLITPGRPMSLEAAAGKNPVSHVGKLYNVLALLIARDIHERLELRGEVHVQLLSGIGDPVDEPQEASIEIIADSEPSPAALGEAAEIANRRLSDIPTLTQMILEGQVALY